MSILLKNLIALGQAPRKFLIKVLSHILIFFSFFSLKYMTCTVQAALLKSILELTSVYRTKTSVLRFFCPRSELFRELNQIGSKTT